MAIVNGWENLLHRLAINDFGTLGCVNWFGNQTEHSRRKESGGVVVGLSGLTTESRNHLHLRWLTRRAGDEVREWRSEAKSNSARPDTNGTGGPALARTGAGAVALATNAAPALLKPGPIASAAWRRLVCLVGKTPGDGEKQFAHIDACPR